MSARGVEAPTAAVTTDFAHALKDAGLAGLIAFGLFLPLIGFRAVQDIHNELVLETRWPLLSAFVILAMAGRLFGSLVVTPWRERRAARPRDAAKVRPGAPLARLLAPAATGFVIVYPLLALWLAGIILLLFHFPSLKRDLWDHTFDPAPNRARLLPQVFVILLGCALAAVILYNNKLRFRPDPKIRGAWKFAAEESLRRVYFEKGHTCVIKDNEGGLHFAHYETRANRLLTVTGEESPIHWQQTPYHFENGSLIITTESGQQVLVVSHQAAKK
jgi:hypothetical protein